MKRIIEDKQVAKIKQMLSQNYKSVSIRDFMEQKHGVCVSSAQIQSIKRIEAYRDVRPDLNDIIRKTYSRRETYDTEQISSVKWALANGYSNEEITKVYELSNSKLTKIRLGHMPYYSIAPEYNYQIEKRFKRKKQTNIDRKMVLSIKKEYVDNNGDVLLDKIAEKHKIDRGTVSTILTLKCYKKMGISFNSKILSIKRKQEEKKKAKERKKIEMLIEKEKLNKEALELKKKHIEDKLRESSIYLKQLKASA